MIRQCDSRDFAITRVMRGADYWTEHSLVRVKVNLSIRPPRKLIINQLKFYEVQGKFRSDLTEALAPELQHFTDTKDAK
ncbi:hypothetical protein HOLleu_28046 [Holothuria leucospilota]|uniref:Uncharacterized protein n=1 Tax=Holothuria leucospilota TaxID=206669 RepID=A0A9Q1BRG4_HOLLE|nr:hypothetical protein HOLleu_28046 [Holothuria leucospilota]